MWPCTPQDVVDAANSRTFSEEGKFRLLVRYVLMWFNSDSERDASSGSCGDFGHVLHVANPPLKRHCVQVVHVSDNFCFLWVPPPLRLWRVRRRVLAGTSALRSADTECHRRPCATGPPNWKFAVSCKFDCVFCLQALKT